MKSERLVLGKFREEDFENYLRLVQNEQVMKLVTGRTLPEQEAEEKFNKFLAINLAHAALGYFAVRTISKNTFIGFGKIALTEEDEAEIGYLLLPESWGKGYGSEITQCLVELPCLKALSAIIDPENVASKRIPEKNNFRLAKACLLDTLPAEIYKRTIL